MKLLEALLAFSPAQTRIFQLCFTVTSLHGHLCKRPVSVKQKSKNVDPEDGRKKKKKHVIF